MCSRLTFIFQLLDSPMQLPMAFPPGCAKLGLGLGNTVPQASDFIIRHVFHEERGNVSADHLRSPRWDSNYLLLSYDEGGGRDVLPVTARRVECAFSPGPRILLGTFH